MGRWSGSGKTEADDLKKIATSFLRKHDYFCGMRSGIITWTSGWSGDKSSVSITVITHDSDNRVQIRYTKTDHLTGEKKDFDYRIPLTTTPCNFGGDRYWFRCPWYKSGIYCGRRVGVLYLGGDYFACRHCYDLTYSSRKDNRSYRYAPLFSVLKIDNKIEKLEEQIKRRYYAGRPTRKQRRLERLYAQAGMSYGLYEPLERDKMA